MAKQADGFCANFVLRNRTVDAHGGQDGELAVDRPVHDDVCRQASTSEGAAPVEVFACLVGFIHEHALANTNA
tara:strand:+ start:418 stop:636 length:219 start_codon:yes stop_codon:yes gene_type:complete